MKSQAFEAPDPESLQSKSPFAEKLNPRSRPYGFFAGDYIQEWIVYHFTPLLLDKETIGPMESGV